MKPPMTILRLMGHESADYLDDKWLVSKPKMEVEQNIIGIKTILTNLSFIINDGKSVFNFMEKLKHIGFVIDSRLLTVSFTDQKINKLKKLWNKILTESLGTVTIQILPEFLGSLESYSAAVEYAQCFCNILHIEKNEAL